jgi:hypothetical protein
MSPEDIKHFILIYSIPDRKVEVKAFEHDERAALAAYERLEAEHRTDPDVDIVLLGAESEEILRRTHGSYFPDRAERLDDLVERELAATRS